MLSAKRELLLFLVVYMFTGTPATTGQAPIEVIMPEARRMPVYRLINHPLPGAPGAGKRQRTAPDGRSLLWPQEVPA